MPTSPTANSAPSQTFSPAVSLLTRKTGGSLLPARRVHRDAAHGLCAPEERQRRGRASGRRRARRGRRADSRCHTAHPMHGAPSFDDAGNARPRDRPPTVHQAHERRHPEEEPNAAARTKEPGARPTRTPAPRQLCAEKGGNAASSPPRAKVRRKNAAQTQRYGLSRREGQPITATLR